MSVDIVEITGSRARARGGAGSGQASAASVFAALGVPLRMQLVARLSAQGALSISDLADGTPVTRQAVSKHLRVLQVAGLVRSEKAGRETRWTLVPRALAKARAHLDDLHLAGATVAGAFLPAGPTVIHRGDLHWLADEATRRPVPGHAHPHVVVQEDVFNHSRIATVVVCALTSNLAKAREPGNVLLEAGEGALPRRSVVVVSQIEAIEKTRLGPRIGALSAARVDQVLDGLGFLQRAFFDRR